MSTIGLFDVFDRDEFAAMLDAGYIKRLRHPSAPLFIHNYTARTQYAAVWNDVTRACRGLITDEHDQVVARPFAKFFNHSELDLAGMLAEPVVVTEKLDGSLGVLYPTAGGWAIATRGSFVSEQALHATAVFNTLYASRFTPDPSCTYLFEILYPENRIVVNYGAIDDLVLIAVIETATGAEHDPGTAGWPGPVVRTHAYATLSDALDAPAEENAEGLVVRFPSTGMRVKVKHDEYVRLHRLVTGISERRIWEMLAAGTPFGEWLEAVPDELFHFVTVTRDRFLTEHASRCAEMHARYAAFVLTLPEHWDRKHFAVAYKMLPDDVLNRCLFLILDGKPIEHLVWSSLRPAEHRPLFDRTVSE